MSNPVWFGTTAATLQSAQSREDTEERGIVELNFQGSWTSILALAAQYPINSGVSGFNGAVKVNRAYRDTPTGTIGSLYLQIVSPWLNPIYEIDWVEKQVPLYKNVRYNGGTYTLTQRYFTIVAGALNDPSDNNIVPSVSGDSLNGLSCFQAITGGSSTTPIVGNTGAYELYSKIIGGEPTYPVYCPVARQTTFSEQLPVTGGCGRRTAAPSWAPTTDLNGATFFYVKTADRAIKQLTIWQEQIEYTGYTAELFDNQITPGP